MNNKGQFSIIAALLVAVVLVAAVMTTYSAIRYSPVQGQPQILSAVDETNQALKQLLGFTVGYYGSVLKVTGNVTYAQQLATKYLDSGLTNVGLIKPEWGLSLNATDLKLKANWFTNTSYSQGNMSVTYDLNGLGITGISYTASSRLDVQVSNINSTTQAQFKVLTDNGEPLINLGANNIKFYRYVYGNLTWEFSVPTNIISHGDGTYIVDLPPGVPSNSYVVQVEDTRGLSVLASSFSQFTSTIAWNTTAFKSDLDYVDNATLNVLGTHSDFTAQQHGPNDGVFDTLTETASGTFLVPSYPTSYNTLGSTTIVSGTINELQVNNEQYMTLRSYPSAYNPSQYNTIGYDNSNSAVLNPSTTSIQWQHTTGTGNDRILLVAVDVFDRNGGTPVAVTSVTYGGASLTQIATASYSTSPQIRSYVFYLVNPSSGTKMIIANFASSTRAVGGSVTYTNVNQTNPLQISNTITGSGTSQSVSVAASGSYNKMLYGHLSSYGGSSYTVNEVIGQTNRWAQIDSASAGTYAGRGSEKSVTSGSVSMSWTTSSAANWVAIAVLLQPTNPPTEYTCKSEFTGYSNTPAPWNNLAWTIDSSASTGSVITTFQLYNSVTGQYSTGGDGYMITTLGTGDSTEPQTIATTPTNFLNSTGYWKILVTAVKSTSTPFDINLDLMQYSPNVNNYALNLQEQWLNVNATNLRQDLCIKTGTMGSEPLLVQVLHGGSWQNLMTLLPNYFNNASLTPYIDSANLTIRFVGSNDTTDPAIDAWNIDSVYVKDEPDISFLLNLQQSTFTLEVLQNGTMRWLGQNMQLTTQTLPIPPIPVKAIHVNQTINGVNQEVPFQIEDWASNYQIPLGLTSNSTVFGNRQMIVFLLNNKVTNFTVWWDGSDTAVQTSLAYTNRYFSDNVNSATLNNSRQKLQFAASGFTLTSTVGSVTTTTKLMRINAQEDNTDPELSYVIYNGVIRDIVLGEAEFSGGITNCSNTYTNIVITLPANVTYYTYQLRLMFLDSNRPRNISDLSPLRISTNVSPVQIQTENGTLAGFPILQNGTATFANYTSGSWTAHHFSQFISESGKGSGIMFTDMANQKLYAFDTFSGSSSKGALKASSGLLELLPVSSSLVQFTYANDITWQGAVATFDGSTPVCSLYDGTTPMGLWILAEYPPTLTVTAKS